ncbi:hypothetical protein Tfer_0733 [Thermincola ferriacetica]|uniref:Uncharacterized protein n=1 Tax=Thermincola ferriacetica TaxID=281456 RepID=A0A0L6W619_9FIRM|nr:hypothetical protein [Thermincola ferriacetica]KNZ70549.1 hypothetical protein Tfer_0733 [Thermincola ferriacetica]
MTVKGKTGFWLLVIVFSVVTMMAVVSGDSYGLKTVKDMNGSMGFMMKNEHVWGFSLSNILDGLFNANLPHHAETVAGHHPLPFYISSLDLGSSAAILLMLPLMVGASALLVVLWI